MFRNIKRKFSKTFVVKVNNLVDYLNLPKKKREVFGFWYKTPHGYMMGGGNFHKYWKNNYPIQYKVREFFHDVDVWLGVRKRIIGEKLTPLFNPQNKWARKSIPRLWSEYDIIMQDILFNGLVSYIEEGGFENTDWDYDDHYSSIRDRMMAVKSFIKEELPSRIKKEEQLLKDIYSSDEKRSFRDMWGEQLENGIQKLEGERKKKFLLLNLLEEETEELISKNMKEIVELRRNLW